MVAQGDSIHCQIEDAILLHLQCAFKSLDSRDTGSCRLFAQPLIKKAWNAWVQLWHGHQVR